MKRLLERFKKPRKSGDDLADLEEALRQLSPIDQRRFLELLRKEAAKSPTDVNDGEQSATTTESLDLAGYTLHRSMLGPSAEFATFPRSGVGPLGVADDQASANTSKLESFEQHLYGVDSATPSNRAVTTPSVASLYPRWEQLVHRSVDPTAWTNASRPDTAQPPMAGHGRTSPQSSEPLSAIPVAPRVESQASVLDPGSKEQPIPSVSYSDQRSSGLTSSRSRRDYVSQEFRSHIRPLQSLVDDPPSNTTSPWHSPRPWQDNRRLVRFAFEEARRRITTGDGRVVEVPVYRERPDTVDQATWDKYGRPLRIPVMTPVTEEIRMRERYPLRHARELHRRLSEPSLDTKQSSPAVPPFQSVDTGHAFPLRPRIQPTEIMPKPTTGSSVANLSTSLPVDMESIDLRNQPSLCQPSQQTPTIPPVQPHATTPSARITSNSPTPSSGMTDPLSSLESFNLSPVAPFSSTPKHGPIDPSFDASLPEWTPPATSSSNGQSSLPPRVPQLAEAFEALSREEQEPRPGAASRPLRSEPYPSFPVPPRPDSPSALIKRARSPSSVSLRSQRYQHLPPAGTVPQLAQAFDELYHASCPSTPSRSGSALSETPCPHTQSSFNVSGHMSIPGRATPPHSQVRQRNDSRASTPLQSTGFSSSSPHGGSDPAYAVGFSNSPHCLSLASGPDPVERVESPLSRKLSRYHHTTEAVNPLLQSLQYSQLVQLPSTQSMDQPPFVGSLTCHDNAAHPDFRAPTPVGARLVHRAQRLSLDLVNTSTQSPVTPSRHSGDWPPPSDPSVSTRRLEAMHDRSSTPDMSVLQQRYEHLLPQSDSDILPSQPFSGAIPTDGAHGEASGEPLAASNCPESECEVTPPITDSSGVQDSRNRSDNDVGKLFPSVSSIPDVFRPPPPSELAASTQSFAAALHKAGEEYPNPPVDAGKFGSLELAPAVAEPDFSPQEHTGALDTDFSRGAASIAEQATPCEEGDEAVVQRSPSLLQASPEPPAQFSAPLPTKHLEQSPSPPPLPLPPSPHLLRQVAQVPIIQIDSPPSATSQPSRPAAALIPAPASMAKSPAAATPPSNISIPTINIHAATPSPKDALPPSLPPMGSVVNLPMLSSSLLSVPGSVPRPVATSQPVASQPQSPLIASQPKPDLPPIPDRLLRGTISTMVQSPTPPKTVQGLGHSPPPLPPLPPSIQMVPRVASRPSEPVVTFAGANEASDSVKTDSSNYVTPASSKRAPRNSSSTQNTQFYSLEPESPTEYSETSHHTVEPVTPVTAAVTSSSSLPVRTHDNVPPGPTSSEGITAPLSPFALARQDSTLSLTAPESSPTAPLGENVPTKPGPYQEPSQSMTAAPLHYPLDPKQDPLPPHPTVFSPEPPRVPLSAQELEAQQRQRNGVHTSPIRVFSGKQSPPSRSSLPLSPRRSLSSIQGLPSPQLSSRPDLVIDVPPRSFTSSPRSTSPRQPSPLRRQHPRLPDPVSSMTHMPHPLAPSKSMPMVAPSLSLRPDSLGRVSPRASNIPQSPPILEPCLQSPRPPSGDAPPFRAKTYSGHFRPLPQTPGKSNTPQLLPHPALPQPPGTPHRQSPTAIPMPRPSPPLGQSPSHLVGASPRPTGLGLLPGPNLGAQSTQFGMPAGPPTYPPLSSPPAASPMSAVGSGQSGWEDIMPYSVMPHPGSVVGPPTEEFIRSRQQGALMRLAKRVWRSVRGKPHNEDEFIASFDDQSLDYEADLTDEEQEVYERYGRQDHPLATLGAGFTGHDIPPPSLPPSRPLAISAPPSSSSSEDDDNVDGHGQGTGADLLFEPTTDNIGSEHYPVQAQQAASALLAETSTPPTMPAKKVGILGRLGLESRRKSDAAPTLPWIKDTSTKQSNSASIPSLTSARRHTVANSPIPLENLHTRTGQPTPPPPPPPSGSSAHHSLAIVTPSNQAMVLYRSPDAKLSGQPVPIEDASRPSTIVPFRDQSQGSTWTSFHSQGRVHPTPTGPGILNRLMASCLAFLGKPISPDSSLMSSYARIGHRPSEFLPDKSAQPMEDRLVSEPTVHPTDPTSAHAPQLLLPSPPPNGMSDGGALQQDLSPLGDNQSCSQVHDSVPAAPEQMSGAFAAPSRAQLSPNLSLPMKSNGTHPPNLAHPLDPSYPIPGSASKELAASHYSQRSAAIQEAGPGGQPPAPPSPPGPPNPSGVGGPEALSPNSSGPPPPADKSIGYGSSMFTDRQNCCVPWLEHILAGIRAGGTRYGIVADPSARLPQRFQQKAHPLRYPELDAVLETFARPHFDPIPPAQMQHDSPMAASRSHSSHRSRRSQELSANDHHPNQAMELGSGDAKLATTPRAPAAGNIQELDSHDPQMFPPFNILPKGTTVELLQANGGNVEKKSGWSFGTTVLYTAIENIGPLSVMVSNLMKLEVIRDYVQLISVFFHSINEPLYGTLRLVLQDIPQFLSLNWSETWGKTIVFFVLFSVIGFITVFTFRMTKKSIPDSDVEGLEVETWNMASRRSSRTLNRAIVFIITTLYLPLSKLAIEALVWDDKFWPVDNPYLKSDTPSLPPLGPATEFRGPYDFCYTTTMSATGANLTWLILVLAAFCILAVSFYFPWSVRKVIKDNLPVPKNYNMQGETRQSAIDEHKRALAEDDCPYNCLYNMYYPESAAQKTVVMFHKFIYLLIICLFTKDNCVFRDASRHTMDIVRQSLVAVYGTGLFIMHWRLQPYLAASQNISEFVSRSAQVLTGYLGLVVVTHKSTQTALGITIFVLNVIAGIVILYLTLLQLECFRNFIHRARKRLRVTSALYGMDVVNGLEMLRERLWQETWTALLLTCHEFRVPAGEQIAFSESLQRPPYLVQFKGSVAERHLENIRILQHIGAANYYRRVTEAPSPRMLELSRTITSYLVGPDMYYRPPEEQYPTVVTYFGKAYAIPFPFSLVFVYDDDSQVVRVLQTEAELDWYVKCNADPDIIRRKEVRLMIRALEGQEVLRPFQRRPINQPARLSKGLRQTIRRSHRPRFPDLTRSVSSSRLFGSTPSHPYQDLEAGQLRPLTEFTPHIRYTKGYLRIHRVKPSTWQGDYNMNAGFYVQIEYFDGQGVYQPGRTRKVHEKCAISNRRIGLTAEFGMTPQLRALLAANEATIRERYPKVVQILSLYRQMYQDEFERKRRTLSYGFLIKVFNTPQIPQNALWHYLETHEANSLLKDIAVHHYMDIRFLYQRMHWAAHHQVALFWYLIWDDVYRLNHHIVPAFQTHAHHFSPYYPTSLAYFPMPRERLVGYLDHYGLWNNSGKSGFFHHGFLNRIYCYLNRLVFGEEVPVFQGPNAPVPPLPDQRDASSHHLPG